MYNNNKKALLSTALVLSAALDLSPILSPNPGITVPGQKYLHMEGCTMQSPPLQ